MSGRDRNSRGDREMSNLRRLQLQVAGNVRREYRRNPDPSRGNMVWVALFQHLLDELYEREEAMDRKYESVWRDNEDYLSKLDTFIRDLRKFSLSNEVCDEETRRRKDDIKKDMENLQKKIDERGELLGIMSNNLQGLQKTREELLRIRTTPEFALLQNWMRTTCEKCIEMENEISQLKLRISEKNADILETMGHGHDIFSKVSLEELKKQPPFRTDPEASTSSATPLD